MSLSKHAILISLFIFSFFATPALAATDSAPFYKLFYYREGKKAMASFKANAQNIDIIAPQVYGVKADGELKGELTNDFLKIAEDNNVKIMPLITNSNFSEKVLDEILSSSVVQEKIIKAMVKEGKEKGYYGWQFDFEQMTADHRNQYSAFVKRAYKEFKKNNLVFSVAVISQISENPADYPNNLWQRVIGAYDYKVIGKNSDFISIMSYDQPKSPGPVASLDWVKKIISFAITKVPADKISLGVPFYYWKWSRENGKLVDIGGYGSLEELLANKKQIVNQGWDLTYQVPWIVYVKNKKTYTIWYEDARSFASKLNLAKANQLHGFSAWVLGLEDPKIHQVLKNS